MIQFLNCYGVVKIELHLTISISFIIHKAIIHRGMIGILRPRKSNSIREDVGTADYSSITH